jgi:hypothetical protein
VEQQKMKELYLVKFNEKTVKTLYMAEVLHQANDREDHTAEEPEVAVTAFREHAAPYTYDVATFFADIFDGEVEEK